MMEQLTSGDLRRLRDCLLASFPVEELALVARLALGTDLGAALTPRTRARLVSELLARAEQEGRLPQLFEELGKAHPGEVRLHAMLRGLQSQFAGGSAEQSRARRIEELRRRLWAARSREQINALAAELEALLDMPPGKPELPAAALSCPGPSIQSHGNGAPSNGSPPNGQPTSAVPGQTVQDPLPDAGPEPSFASMLAYLFVVLLAVGMVAGAALTVWSNWE